MNNRLKCIRKQFHLTQEEFADRIGIKRGAISNYEIGRNEPIDAVISLICREFNVDYFWLTEGFGEMFTHFDEVIIQELTEMYSLDETEKAIVLAFLESDKETI